jgi:predicted nuclease of predicted toxin-antitoxin system
LQWAQKNNYVIFTHDLDFGALLAATAGNAPSVLQVRTQDVFPENVAPLVINAFRQFQNELMQGALISVDAQRSRVRILPIK